MPEATQENRTSTCGTLEQQRTDSLQVSDRHGILLASLILPGLKWQGIDSGNWLS